jgi:hypothetical protein
MCEFVCCHGNIFNAIKVELLTYRIADSLYIYYYISIYQQPVHIDISWQHIHVNISQFIFICLDRFYTDIYGVIYIDQYISI